MYNRNWQYKNEGSKWFRRFVKDCAKISSHISIKRIKYGFYRLYWTGGGEPAYIGEIYGSMPPKGYDIEEEDPRLMDRNYYEEYEDHVKTVRTLKNFVEGYWDSLITIQRRIYMLKNNAEFRKTATEAFRNIRIK